MNHDRTTQRTSKFIDNKIKSINRYKPSCFCESDLLFEPFECDNFNATKGWFDISTMTWHGRKWSRNYENAKTAI